MKARIRPQNPARRKLNMRSAAIAAALGPIILAWGLAALAQSGALVSEARAQNPEMRARICRNLTEHVEAEGLPDRSDDYERFVGDYDDPERERSNPDWRVEMICDGRFMWAYALFGDVAPFPLMPTEDPRRFTDFRENEWVFAVDDDGGVESLQWMWKSGENFTFVRVE